MQKLHNHPRALTIKSPSKSSWRQPGPSAERRPTAPPRIWRRHSATPGRQRRRRIERLRAELSRLSNEQNHSEAQIKALIGAGSTVSDATEESTPEEAVEKNEGGPAPISTPGTPNTLADPIRLITGNGADREWCELADDLKQTWDKVQKENDDLELAVQGACEKVARLQLDFEAHTQELKTLATDIGVRLSPNIKPSAIVGELSSAFNDLQKVADTREQQRIKARDMITSNEAEIQDLKRKVEALTTSLEELNDLSEKKRIKKGRRMRFRWRRKTSDSNNPADVSKLQDDLVQKNAKISLLEGQMTGMAEDLKVVEKAGEKVRDRLDQVEKSRNGLRDQIKRLEFDNTRKERLIQDLRDLVNVLKTNCVDQKAIASFRITNTVDHVTIATVPSSVQCKKISTMDIIPFKGRGQAGQLRKLKVLGKGTYGKVFLGRYAPTAEPVAIKQLQRELPTVKCNRIEEKRWIKGVVLKESTVQQLVSGSPYFPKMIGVVTLEGIPCTVSEFVGNKRTGKAFPLYSALSRKGPKPKLSPKSMLHVCEDITRGLMELHKHGLLHNDVKCNNVLLEKRSQRWHGVIIDFGLCSATSYSSQRDFGSRAKSEYKAGRGLFFLAPEVVLKGELYSVLSDIFSLGILFETIVDRRDLHDLMDLALTCQDANPLKRPHTMSEVLQKIESIRSSI
ncbi:uncharacterized protein [Diadema antillarum]|uniref:uncharacterized protein n=1 Tax=Diadema antillarum TaxID=105358 RepID=UPI003A85359A